MRLFRIIIIGLCWTYLYCLGMIEVFMRNWNFHPLVKTHWLVIIEKWNSGWVINTKSEIIFAMLLIAFVPLWIAGWSLSCYISYKKVFLFPFRLIKSILPKKKQMTALEAVTKAGKVKKAKKKKKKKKPTKAGVYKAPAPAQPSPKTSADENEAEKEYQYEEEPQARPPEFGEIEQEETNEQDTSLETQNQLSEQDNKKADRTAIIEELKEYGNKNGYIVFSDMEMGKNKVDLVFISKDIVFLVTFSPEGSEWVADEESFTDEPPVWFSEDDFEVSPVYKMLEAQTLLEEMIAILLPENYQMEVLPTIVVADNTILNGETMLPSWIELGAAVVSYKDGKPKEMPSLEQIISPRGEDSKIEDEILDFISLALVSVSPDKEAE